MGLLYLEYIGTSQVYTCSQCSTHLSSRGELESKDFWAGNGKAYLYKSVINISAGPTEERLLRTGLHIVRDIFCQQCNVELGWMYEWAQNHDQKYKEGKFILVRGLVNKVEWD